MNGRLGSASLTPASATAVTDGPSLTPGAALCDWPGCAWCRRRSIDTTAVAPAGERRYGSQRCRQAAWRLRQLQQTFHRTNRPLLFAYADPPYPGMAWSLYRQPEVDHRKLIAKLEAQRHGQERPLAGWALSTGAYALREILPLCPPEARVCAWVKPIGASTRTLGLHNCWEPLIVVPGRRRRPGIRDWLAAQPARRGGDLIGRKPLAFCAWLFRCLGMLPGDTLVDLFPGTGIVTRAWANLSSAAVDDE